MSRARRLSLQLRRHGPLWLGVAALLGVACYLVLQSLAGPTLIRVGVRSGSPEAQMLSHFAAVVKAEKRPLSVVLRPYGSDREMARALHERTLDVAALRPDLGQTESALSLAVLANDAILFAAAKGRSVEDITSLGGKRLGIAADLEPLSDTILRLFDFHDVTRPTLVVIDLQATDRLEGIDALAFSLRPSAADLGDRLRSIAGRLGPAPQLLAIPEVKGFVQQYPVYGELAFQPGELTRRPKLPEDELTTLSVSVRLMAEPEYDRRKVSLLLEQMFQLRAAVAHKAPDFAGLRGLDADEAPQAGMAVHPGATDYYAREQQTFMDLYGDWLWLGLFAGGGVTSSASWLAQTYLRRRRRAIDTLLDRLESLLARAQTADASEADDLAAELGRLVSEAIRYTRRQRTNTQTMGSLMLAIDATRAAIKERQTQGIPR